MDASQVALIVSMMFDMGWKVWTETTKNMTPDELDAFIANREQSIADVKARLEAKYGQP
jgi:hypothetical protein